MILLKESLNKVLSITVVSAIVTSVLLGLLPNSNQQNFSVCVLKTLKALKESNYLTLVSYGQNPIVEDLRSSLPFKSMYRLTLSCNKLLLLNLWSLTFSVKTVNRNGPLILGLLKSK